MSTSDLDKLDLPRENLPRVPTPELPNVPSNLEPNKPLSVEKLKAILKTKRGVLTRGLKTFENFLQSDFDQQLILKSYEKVCAVKQDMDILIDQLTTIEDFPPNDLTEELKTHESYSISFEKMEELYF